ncbi:fascin domain-containing protein [Micromonospora chersina]
MNNSPSPKHPRAAIVATVIASVAILLTLLPAPASAAKRESSVASTVQTCNSTYIWARANSTYVSAVLDASNYPLRARAGGWGAWENFGITPYNGKYVIYSWAAGRYVSANVSGTGNGALQATAKDVGPWELFDVVVADEGWYAIKAAANGKYVTANVSSGNNGALQAKADRIGTWEMFDLNLNC